MEDIDPRLLRAFLHVAGEGSFTAAARALDLAPKTVSLRVRVLEKRLGMRLFERKGRGVVPAPAAASLLPAAREIVDMNDRLFERARGLGRNRP